MNTYYFIDDHRTLHVFTNDHSKSSTKIYLTNTTTHLTLLFFTQSLQLVLLSVATLRLAVLNQCRITFSCLVFFSVCALPSKKHYYSSDRFHTHAHYKRYCIQRQRKNLPTPHSQQKYGGAKTFKQHSNNNFQSIQSLFTDFLTPGEPMHEY